MKSKENNSSNYHAVHENDEDWGLIVTSAGFQDIEPFEFYPLAGQPEAHNFYYEDGRVLAHLLPHKRNWMAGLLSWFSSGFRK